ncbi:hypothetical protein OF001_U150036 [Pseudomonas sp. OF001]|nr:hypothetical protein OF001_U150036 [Pseudomonas sp. OF001]
MVKRLSEEPSGFCDLEPAAKANPEIMAQWTGLEPATPGVTGRYSNRLNYHCASAGLASEYFIA